MIRSFKSKALERFWLNGNSKGLSVNSVPKIAARLQALSAATKPSDMDLPGYRFHALKGEMSGRYSVRVTGNYRITFGWSDDGPDAIDVDYEDYH